VAAYKSPANVERALRSIKTADPHVRPVLHYSAEFVRAHVFFQCMMAYFVKRHMRERLKPLLFDDEVLDEMQAARTSPVKKAWRSDHTKATDVSKHDSDGVPPCTTSGRCFRTSAPRSTTSHRSP
jgi:hypothetical protein